MYDLLLKGGRIYDGSGMPSYQGDVGIKNGKIVEIGRLKESATRTLNVDGLAVAPGFIDPHTHLDAQLFWDPLGTSSCFHDHSRSERLPSVLVLTHPLHAHGFTDGL